jgi:hypothetical protein
VKNTLAWIYSTKKRKKQFCTETLIHQQGTEHPWVEKRHLITCDAASTISIPPYVIKHRTFTGPYIFGSSLHEKILHNKLAAINEKSLAATLHDWLHWLKQSASVVSGCSGNAMEHWTLPPDWIDATPFNIVSADGNATLIDKEWLLDAVIPLGWVILRGAISICINGSSFHLTHININLLFQYLTESLQLTVKPDSLSKWKELENMLHAGIFVGTDKIPDTIQVTQINPESQHTRSLQQELDDKDLRYYNLFIQHRKAEDLALQRLALNTKLDNQLKATSQALHSAQTMAMERLREASQLDKQIHQLNIALEDTKSLATRRLQEIDQLEKNSRHLDHALESTKIMALTRLEKIESLNNKLTELRQSPLVRLGIKARIIT